MEANRFGPEPMHVEAKSGSFPGIVSPIGSYRVFTNFFYDVPLGIKTMAQKVRHTGSLR
jgi:hypothetical protein